MEGTNSTKETPAGTNSTKETLRYMKLVGYAVVFVVGVLLNILLLLAVTRKRIRHRNTSRTFIIIMRNLAVADLLMLVSTIPFDAAWHESNEFPYGAGMCTFLWPFQTACFQAVVFTYVILSFHRTYGVKTLFGQMNSAFGYVICLGIWLASIATVIPYMVFLKHTSGKVASCDEDWKQVEHRQTYTVILFLLQYLIPLLVMTVFALVTRTELQSSSHRRSQDPAVRQRRDRHHRVNVMLILYLVVFAVLLLPHQIMWFMLDFGNGVNEPHFFDVLNFLYVFTYSITVTNVVLFFMHNNEFKSDMWYFLRCYFCRSDAYSVRDDESDSFSVEYDPNQHSLRGNEDFQLEQPKGPFVDQTKNREVKESRYNPANSVEL